MFGSGKEQSTRGLRLEADLKTIQLTKTRIPWRWRYSQLLHGTRFMVVVWTGTGVNTAAIYLFKGIIHLPIIPASLIAIELAIIHNFIWLRHWAWADRRMRGGLRAFFRQLAIYHVCTGTTDFFVSVPALWLLYKFAGVHYLLANIAGMIVGPFLKFWLNEKIVFNEGR